MKISSILVAFLENMNFSNNTKTILNLDWFLLTDTARKMIIKHDSSLEPFLNTEILNSKADETLISHVFHFCIYSKQYF